MRLRNRYSIRFKLKCLEIVNFLGIYKTSQIIGINKKSVKNWDLNREKLRDINEKNSLFRLSDERSRVKYPELEEKIVVFILRCKEIGINFNSNGIL